MMDESEEERMMKRYAKPKASRRGRASRRRGGGAAKRVMVRWVPWVGANAAPRDCDCASCRAVCGAPDGGSCDRCSSAGAPTSAAPDATASDAGVVEGASGPELNESYEYEEEREDPAAGASGEGYPVVPGREYGGRWRSSRPPGLPASARRSSPSGMALPMVAVEASKHRLGEWFVKLMIDLAKTESGGTYALPANIFDARPRSQRPADKSLITAWGVFQFNGPAWCSLNGFNKADCPPEVVPWNVSPRDEIARPVARYAAEFRRIKALGGNDLDAARGVRLWQRSPSVEYAAYVKRAPGVGFPRAWSAVDPKERAAVDAALSKIGLPASSASGPSASPEAPTPAATCDATKPAAGTTEPRRAWPTNPPLRGDRSNRSRALYDRVINQFAAGANPRYAHRKDANGRTSTFCNIFAWDVTRAMGAEIPHWVDAKGDPAAPGKGHELNANAINGWLHAHGPRFGWRPVAAQQAVALASAGRPVVASWKNPKGIGHIAVIRPGEMHPEAGPLMAQAGAKNRNCIRMFRAAGREGVWKKSTAVQLFAHD